MNDLEWIDYPESSPEQSGSYVVNRDVNNAVSNTIAYYDIEMQRWYVDNNEMVPLGGVTAFNNQRIIPLIRQRRQ